MRLLILLVLGLSAFSVVGNTIAQATEIAQSQGYPFVVVGSADGVTATIAHTGRRIEARTKDGVVVSARVFEQ